MRKKPEKRHRVVCLAYHGLATFEFGVAVEFFGLPRPEFPGWYEFRVCGVDSGPIRATGGFTLNGTSKLSALREADTIVIPGWRGIHAEVPPALIAALRKAYQRGARIMSFCSGAFVLARAGLLDGRRGATHWKYVAALKEKYPEIDVVGDVLYADEGQVLSSAGSAAAIDLCLHVVRRDFGPKIANHVARRLVVAPHREGGQSQFIETPVVPLDDPSAIQKAMLWARRHLEQDVSVERLAKQAKMSARSFARHFRATTGSTPHQWLTHERVLLAQELLEQSNLPMDDVAARSGFGTAPNFRHHFRKAVRLSPTAYRRRFHQKHAGTPG